MCPHIIDTSTQFRFREKLCNIDILNHCSLIIYWSFDQKKYHTRVKSINFCSFLNCHVDVIESADRQSEEILSVHIRKKFSILWTVVASDRNWFCSESGKGGGGVTWPVNHLSHARSLCKRVLSASCTSVCKSKSCFCSQQPNSGSIDQQAERHRRVQGSSQRLHWRGQRISANISTNSCSFMNVFAELFTCLHPGGLFIAHFLTCDRQDVTPQNFLAVLSGKSSKAKGKVLKRREMTAHISAAEKSDSSRCFVTLLSLFWQRPQWSRVCVLHWPRGAWYSGISRRWCEHVSASYSLTMRA